MSQIIQLNNGLYTFTTPKLPRDEKEILFYDQKKTDQYWRTPIIENVKKMPEKKRIEYIDFWRDKWENGLWFFNNGEPTYITGMHVDHLVFATYNSRKLSYFEDERNSFYFRDLTNRDPTCDGRTWIKPRRAKFTTEECTEAQYKMMSDFSNFIAIQSDTLTKAQLSYMNPIIDSYVARPYWMREEYYAPNGKKPKKSLSLTSVKIEQGEDPLLGGWIYIFPALAKAIDGLEAFLVIMDEFSKWEDVSPYETLEVNLKVIHNFNKHGKIDCGSTTGDSKDAAKATMDWHKLIAKSNPNNRDENGKTISGLWKYFISAIHSQYVPADFTNKYGQVNKDQAEAWVQAEHNKYAQNTKERIFAMYKLPLKEEHALLSSTMANIFSKPRISARLSELEALPPDRLPYVRGRLEEDQKGKVYFEADPAGIWMWAVQPFFSIEKNIDTRNRFRVTRYDDKLIYWPPINPEGAIGYDPINFTKANTKSSNLSQVAIVIHKKFNYFGAPVEDEDVKMAFALWRPEDPRDANKEVMKACKFTGYPCMHERSVDHVYEDFNEAGMLPFLLKMDGVYGIPPLQGRKLSDGITMLRTRYAPPRNPEDKDHIAIHPFEDCLRSHDNFDPSNTTQFDPTMAEIDLEYGLKQLEFTNQTDSGQNQWIKWATEIVAPRN